DRPVLRARDDQPPARQGCDPGDGAAMSLEERTPGGPQRVPGRPQGASPEVARRPDLLRPAPSLEELREPRAGSSREGDFPRGPGREGDGTGDAAARIRSTAGPRPRTTPRSPPRARAVGPGPGPARARNSTTPRATA